MAHTNVYFSECAGTSRCSDRIKATKRVLEASAFDDVMMKKSKVGVKLHVGEGGNTTFVSPEIIKAIVSRIKRNGGFPFLTETQTLYKGNRSNAIDHLNQAYAHGFTPKNVGAPFIMADGLLGDSEMEVNIEGRLYKRVSIAREITKTDVLILCSHPTGHMKSGLGASIKNLGMGCASRKGKLRQHSAIKPYVKASACTLCGKCISWCPRDAVIEKEKSAFIIEEKCIGCGQCLTVCAFDAVKYNWAVEAGELQKRMAEHALGVVSEKRDRIYFLNFLFDMTAECDCWDRPQKPVMEDIGVLASSDPVAIDQATLDITRERTGSDLGRKSFPLIDPEDQLRHGEEIGLGRREYTLIKA
ncbi:MAG: DUF362 domain-containing protein [Spirochaetales bacterium]|nr:DUF362 domain-containing protein [Spirochaetales bacterium]